jgi:protein-disulfide isomerase
MTNTRWAVFVCICLAIIGGLVISTRRDKVNVSTIDPNAILTTGSNADHVLGDKSSKIVLIEYGDYQCPSCQGTAASLKPIVEEYKDQIAFVFRHFPLTTIHPNALAAAATAEAAGLQGKFWEMHDLLYTERDSWSNISAEERTKLFSGYAKGLDLDVARFDSDITSEKVSAKINYDRALAKKLGIEGTPTIFLNGKKLDNNTIS